MAVTATAPELEPAERMSSGQIAAGKDPVAAGPGRVTPDDERIVEVAKANPTDGSRIRAQLLAPRFRETPLRESLYSSTTKAIRLKRPEAVSSAWDRLALLPREPLEALPKRPQTLDLLRSVFGPARLRDPPGWVPAAAYLA